MQPTTSSSRPCSATSSRRPFSLRSYLRPFVFLRRGARESAGLPVVYDNMFGSTSCCTAYLLWQSSKLGTRPRSASRGTSHWNSTVSLFVSSPLFLVAALNPLLPHLGGFFFSRFLRGFFATFRPATCSRGTATPGPRVLRHFGRTRKSSGGCDAGISQNFLTSPAHGPGWPS